MELNNINPVEPQIEANLEINSQPNIPKKIKTFPIVLVVGIIIGIILTASVASAFYFYQVAKTKSLISITPTPTPETNSSQVTQFGTITWLTQPQKVSSLPILKDTKDFDTESPEGILFFSKINFYLVANFSDGSQLIKITLPSGEKDTNEFFTYHIVKHNDGKFSLVRSNYFDYSDDSDYYTDEFKKYLISSVESIDLNITGLNPPKTINYNDSFLKLDYFYYKSFETLSNPKLIKTTNDGDFYVVYSLKKNIEEVYTQSFYLKSKDGSLFTYSPNYDFINDDRTVKLQWNENPFSTDQFESRLFFNGCGAIDGSDIIKNDSKLLENKVIVGSYNGKNVYQIKDINSHIVQNLYESYKSSHQYDTSYKLLNINDFSNIKNHFLYQDSFGDWVIFVNQSYTLQAECGKPVIYLYPTKETQVSVKVGAKITKSEPEYPTTGWTVVAKPNGELSYQNKIYPNLFWEGLGNGLYPNYRNRGIVVSQKDLISTVYKQLSQQGLNTQESADFMDFWQSKLPNTPYVRLTWLGTKDMDILAPLTVDPRPDTKIRIFLEFEGLQNPVKLIPQQLSAPKREGFTLIEWGGLLLKK